MYKRIVNSEGTKYIEQYHNAIFKLMNNDNGLKYIYPLISLIHQTIENELKLLVVEPEYDSKTFSEEKIGNTHDLKELICHPNLKRLYDEIEECKNVFEEYSKVIEYFYNVLGKDTFLNSRYPVERKENSITLKKEVDIEEFYCNWTRYSQLSSEIQMMNIGYINSNIFIYLKNKGNSTDDINKYERELFDIDELEPEMKQKILKYMKEYIKRNKYFDIKYVNNTII